MDSELRAIDCVVYTVEEDAFPEAVDHYRAALGLDVLWERDDQVGFGLAAHEEGVCELVLSTDTSIPDGLVHYRVESVENAVDRLTAEGYEVVDGPFEIPAGVMATVRNEWGHEFDLLSFES